MSTMLVSPKEKIEKKQSFLPTILFYSDIARLFRSTLIGYLYEISQLYPVVLLSEELDPETQKLIENKKLFPKLNKIIKVHQFTGPKMNLVAKNKHLYKLARDVVQDYQPNIVIATGNYFFESYLRRFANEIGAVTISGVGPILIKDLNKFQKYRLLLSATKMNSFLPLSIRLWLARTKKSLGHILYYWILPLLIGQKPFIGEPSQILWDFSRWRGADYYFVFSKRDKNTLARRGVPLNKLKIITHPIGGKSGEFFKETYFSAALKKHKNNTKKITIFWPMELMGFRKDDYSLVSKEEKQKCNRKILDIISKSLKGWKIFIKPHPMFKNNPAQFQEVIQTVDSVTGDIKITDPSEPADEYIEISDVIVNLPLVSTTLFTASLQCPQKPILSLDLKQEVLADFYMDSNMVDYIDEEKKLAQTLHSIQKGQYQKRLTSRLNQEEFVGIVDFIKQLNIIKT